MIAGIRGTIAGIETQAVIVDLHGLLLRVSTSSRAAATLGSVGEPVELITHLVVREDSLTLYGFPDRGELDLFLLLLGVNGVGPRVALNVLSYAEPATLFDAIRNEDVALLSKAPGIGKTTANRIVFDLKRKLPDYVPGEVGSADNADREAYAALEALGYTPLEARNALAAVAERGGMSVEERVFAALQQMAGR
jgi:Holliday junction DNA helicase RuvA